MTESIAENKALPAAVDKIVIRQPPSPRQVFWISAPEDAKEPEFTGFHPGIIIRGCKTLNEATDTVVFVPITSTEPKRDVNGKYPRHVIELSSNPNPNSDRRVWAICSHVMTTDLTRLRSFRTNDGHRVPKISTEDFSEVLDGIIWNQGSLRNHIQNILDEYLYEAHEKHTQEMEALKTSFEANLNQKIEERALELARQMVAQNNFELRM